MAAGAWPRVSPRRMRRVVPPSCAHVLNDGGGTFDLVMQPAGAGTASPPAPPTDQAATIEEAARRPTLLPGETVAVRLEGGQAAIFGLPQDGRRPGDDLRITGRHRHRAGTAGPRGQRAGGRMTTPMVDWHPASPSARSRAQPSCGYARLGTEGRSSNWCSCAPPVELRPATRRSAAAMA
jgi:hypothetical protein